MSLWLKKTRHNSLQNYIEWHGAPEVTIDKKYAKLMADFEPVNLLRPKRSWAFVSPVIEFRLAPSHTSEQNNVACFHKDIVYDRRKEVAKLAVQRVIKVKLELKVNVRVIVTK